MAKDLSARKEELSKKPTGVPDSAVYKEYCNPPDTITLGSEGTVIIFIAANWFCLNNPILQLTITTYQTQGAQQA